MRPTRFWALVLFSWTYTSGLPPACGTVAERGMPPRFIKPQSQAQSQAQKSPASWNAGLPLLQKCFF
jgi:hypothetical protein